MKREQREKGGGGADRVSAEKTEREMNEKTMGGCPPEDVLSAYADGEETLTAEQQAHVRNCPACGAYLRFCRAAGRAAAAEEPPDGMAERICAKTEADRRRRRRIAWGIRYALFALMGLA